ncbi:FliM/FliN family flagellar motor switch protein [Paracoccus cavernae]|uniref:FliM/FliN family flagellar motor switch protein n=1 Tax=Paracoccus cavernae TaxID=1571207 RepID=UPI0035F2C010
MEGSEPSIAAPLAPSGRASHADILRAMIVSRPESAPEELSFTPDFDALPEVEVDIGRAAAVALGRTADRLYGLPVFVENVANAPATPAELAELFPERALLAVVQGDGDRLGVVALCPSLIASLIEMQAIGRVSARAVRARKPTRTDAAITADFVNRLLCELGNALPDSAGGPDFASYRYASFLDDARPLLLMLEDAPLANLTLNFRIGSGGQRDGKILVALPEAASPALPDFGKTMAALTVIAPESRFAPDEGRDIGPSGFPDAAESTADPDSLAQAVRQAPIPLQGVLCRRQMTLRAIRALKPGDLIALPTGILNETRLETGNGQILAKGRLGEADGLHAIRLHGPEHGAGTSGIVMSPPSGLIEGDHLPLIDTREPDHFRLPPDGDDNHLPAQDIAAQDFSSVGFDSAPTFDPDFGASSGESPEPAFASDFVLTYDEEAAEQAEGEPPFDIGTLPSFG